MSQAPANERRAMLQSTNKRTSWAGLGHELVGDGGEELWLVVLGGHHVGGLGLHREPLARRALLPASLGLGLANLVGVN